jgi:iron complex outermembrane receptor protein
MARFRRLFPALIGALLSSSQLGAQDATGTITGRVMDGPTQQPLGAVTIQIVGTQRGTLSRPDGSYSLTAVPAGTHRLRTTRIGYTSASAEVTVAAGGSATADFTLTPAAVVLEEIVSVGYGTQRREAVTGSVATINADAANVGVVKNVNDMIQGRAAGVTTIQNNGEPGAGVQIRIRGGTSISASNEPLYVIDGVPVNNVETETAGIGIGGEPPLPRNPMNLLNPADIASITVLKDASATAIYGSRGANGVILIETKKGPIGAVANVDYDGYVAAATRSEYLDVLNGDDYRAFVQEQVDLGNLAPERLDNLGTANTDWERELSRTGLTHNHNLAFAGGGDATRYRASLNYMNQTGVVISNGFERYQGRLNGTHQAMDGKLRLGLNMTASRVENDYLAFENTGGFEGGVFMNAAIFNPTRPVTVTDPATETVSFYEAGTGRQAVRNPVAMANQVQDFGSTTRALGNVTAELDLFPSVIPGLTGSLNLGADITDGLRQIYLPRSSPVGAEWGGRAQQANRDNRSVTFQSLLNYRTSLLEQHDIDVVGGYEFSEYRTEEFGAEGRGYITDAFSFYNLGGGAELVRPWSWANEHRLVSFFTRANYSFADRYFLTGVLRRDGSSRFGAGNKWAVFPAISAAWNIAEEPFMAGSPFSLSDLRLRAGWGVQGNPAVPPYASLILLETNARYVFGETPVTGVAPVRNPNPNLKWEETQQYNVAVDYGFLDQRFAGTVEYYIKKTSDLLLTVPVPQPALVGDRLENIGEIENRGLELSLDAQMYSRPNLNWLAGLVFAAERNEVVSLGGRSFITSGGVSGQGQTGQTSQRIMPGYALGTFYGPVFAGVDEDGRQTFRCSSGAGCVGGVTTTPTANDYTVLGDANPDWSFGLRNQVDWGRFDMSMLIRGEMGRDVFNNTSLVYATTSNAKQDKNFLRSALNDPTSIDDPAIFSSRWIEDGSFVRLQNITVGYTFDAAVLGSAFSTVRDTRVYVSGDNLLLLSDYSGLDPEVHVQSGLASRGIDYLAYPRARTFTAGVRFAF